MSAPTAVSDFVARLVALVGSFMAAEGKVNNAEWSLTTFFLDMAAGLSLSAFEKLRGEVVDGYRVAVLADLSKKDREVWENMTKSEREKVAKTGAWQTAGLARAWSRLNVISVQLSKAAVVARASIMHDGFRANEVAEYRKVDAKGRYVGNLTNRAIVTLARAIEEEYRSAKKNNPQIDAETVFAGIASGAVTAERTPKSEAEKVREAWDALVKRASKSEDARAVLVECIQSMLSESAKQDNGTAPLPKARASKKIAA